MNKKEMIENADRFGLRKTDTHTEPFDREMQPPIGGSGRGRGLLMTPSNTSVIWVQLQAQRNYSGSQAACNHLAQSQTGRQPVS